jgi:hypothetical protein
MSKILGVFGVFVFFGMFVFSNFAFASCAVNEDWAKAPCFDVLPVNREEYRAAWAPYHDYKGSEWMEQKKVELLQAIEDGTFMEWENSAENSNVYQYYHSIGLVPNQYEYFFFDDDPRHYSQFFTQGWMFLVLIGVSAGLVAGAAAFIVRKRK